MPEERLRAEYIAGAEDEWRKRTGRAMSTAELSGVRSANRVPCPECRRPRD
jgi:hypothetical protein